MPIGFEFPAESFREKLMNASEPISEIQVNSLIGPQSNFARSSAYRNPEADIRQYPEGKFTEEGFVTDRYPKNVFVLGKDVSTDTIPHEVTHTQQHLMSDDAIKLQIKNDPKFAQAKQELDSLLPQSGLSAKAQRIFKINGQNSDELPALLQGLEGALPEGINVFDKHFPTLSPESRRIVEQYMFPNQSKMFQGTEKSKSPTQSIVEHFRRTIRNWTAY